MCPVLRSWLEPEAWAAWEESERAKQAMKELEGSGGGVLVQYVEQGKEFTQTEWQEKAAGLSEEQRTAISAWILW